MLIAWPVIFAAAGDARPRGPRGSFGMSAIELSTQDRRGHRPAFRLHSRRTNEGRCVEPTSIPFMLEFPMCRNIRTLFNFEPPATEDEIRASAVQFVRKLSGFTRPSKANEAAFQRAVDEVSDAGRRLLDALETASPPRNREAEAVKARARTRERFA
jgi:hypothetical protein